VLLFRFFFVFFIVFLFRFFFFLARLDQPALGGWIHAVTPKRQARWKRKMRSGVGEVTPTAGRGGLVGDMAANSTPG